MTMTTMVEPICERIIRQLQIIDGMVDRVDRYRVEPVFSQKVEKREGRSPDFEAGDDYVLRRLVALIAYSNTAQAKRVKRLLADGILAGVFQNFSVPIVAALDPKRIVQTHWPKIKAIRFKYKVGYMIDSAKCLCAIQSRHGSFMAFLKTKHLPARIKTESDLRRFWEGFDQIKDALTEIGMPYFGNFTSLCHLLMDMGFDCSKPDLAVMKSAEDLGIVPPAPKQKKNPTKSRNHPEASLRKAVETIQAYALCRETRAPILDLYFLVHGGQTGVKELVKESYYYS